MVAFEASMRLSVSMPAGESSVASIVSSSKNLPPRVRNSIIHQ
jgi:hypothetical protein